MRTSFVVATAGLAAGAFGCGDGGPGPRSGSLAVESTRPASGATGVEAGTTLTLQPSERSWRRMPRLMPKS